MSIVKAITIVGDMIDSSMNKVIEEFQERKENEVMEVILRDKNGITSDMVNDVEFIVNFARARKVVRGLATNDKVMYFGNLIKNGYLSGEHIENSEVEEYETESGDVDAGDNIFNSLVVESNGFYIDNSFHRFYNMVLEVEEQ